jgi:acyl-CoA synthetase (AMP-forming)/AMP-acid ligase II
MLPDVQSRIIFVPAQLRGHDYAAMMTQVCGRLEQPPEVVVLRGDAGDHRAFETLLREPAPDCTFPTIDPDAVHMILYTSGTTGDPKGVMHSHNSIRALVRQLGRHWLIEPGDTFLVPSPISHIGGSIYAFELPLLLGTSAVLMERWDADAAIGLSDRYRCTHMAGATPFLDQLLEAGRRKGSRLPSLKLFICGGASIPPGLIHAAAEHFEHAVVTRVYGSTEVPVITVGVLDPKDIVHAAETDGRPGIAELKLVAHAAAATADDGEIYACGPQMLVGYVHVGDEAGVFDAGGFYRTGDLGHLVDGEFLVISGRAKDIIIRKGENISPKEVEDVLREHPEIVEVAIIGLPDPATGERACAVVVARHSARPGLESITGFLKAQGIAAFKRPEKVVLWDALPKNATGKVLKHQIRATLLASVES